MHVSDMNAKKDLNAYRRHMATAILVVVKLAGKDDTARKVIFLSILSYILIYKDMYHVFIFIVKESKRLPIF